MLVLYFFKKKNPKKIIFIDIDIRSQNTLAKIELDDNLQYLDSVRYSSLFEYVEAIALRK